MNLDSKTSVRVHICSQNSYLIVCQLANRLQRMGDIVAMVPRIEDIRDQGLGVWLAGNEDEGMSRAVLAGQGPHLSAPKEVVCHSVTNGNFNAGRNSDSPSSSRSMSCSRQPLYRQNSCRSAIPRRDALWGSHYKYYGCTAPDKG